MRLIRPGKGGASKESAPKEVKPARDVWDDYGEQKKARRKKEYEKSDSPRTTLRPVRPSLNFNATRNNSDGNNSHDAERRFDDGRTGLEGAGGEESSDQSSRDYSPLETKLHYHFSDRALLTRALTHRSALGLKERTDYERLEFLGDAVLDLSVAHLLCEKYPEAKEGELSKMRAALVNTQALASVGRELEIGPFIRLGRGESSSGGQERPSILADVVEAVIGAMYQDSSYDRAFQAIQTIFGPLLERVQPSDPKTELQEALHAAGSEPPTYLLEHVEGPEHAPTFVTVVLVDGEVAGRGRGNTKKGAQQAAAAEALQRMVWSAPSVELAEGQQFLLEKGLLLTPVTNGATAAEESASGDGETGVVE